jgi:UDP-glucose 4-epimerase
MKVFITGAAGFIGSYIIPELLRNGEEVVAFDIAPLPEHLSQYGEKLQYVRGDLTDRVDLYRAMVRTKPTHVLHLGSILAGPCEENPTKGFDINFNSTATLLDAAHSIGVERFVITSSISVFGPGLKEPVEDEAEKLPALVYGQTKLACEHLLNWYEKKGRVFSGGVRFPWVFGPGRTTGITALWSSKLLDQVAREEKIEIENPEQVGNWLYVKDAVKALMMMLNLKEKAPRNVYNIMGSAHTIREVMERAKKLKPGTELVFKEGSGPASPYPSTYDDGNAQKELGWRPDYTIDDAIKEHIEVVGGS